MKRLGENMLPNFICPGAAKAATTTIYNILNQHPEVFLPKKKETEFFVKDYEKGISWYSNHYFNAVQSEKIIGDISPSYLMDNSCPEKILNNLGKDTKILIILREPVARAISHYKMLKSQNLENLSFVESLSRDEGERKRKSMTIFGHDFGFQYIKESEYLESVKAYSSRFKNIKFILFEEFIKDMNGTTAEILEFLDIDRSFAFDYDIDQNVSVEYAQNVFVKFYYTNAMMKVAKDFVQNKFGWTSGKIIKAIKRKLFYIGKQDSNEIVPEELKRNLYNHFSQDFEELAQITSLDLNKWHCYE